MKNNISYYIGVDLGGTTTKIGIVDKDGKLLLFNKTNTDVSENGKNILVNIANQIEEIILEAKIPRKNILGIGIGVPGPVDKNGNVKFAINLGWKEEFNIQEELQKLTGIPVKAANDATLAILGETWIGSAKDIQNAIMITLGTGVGGGIVVNGKIVYGANGEAGEFGHILICDEENIIKEKCKCGKVGCLEQYISANGIVNLAIQLAKNMLKYPRENDLQENISKDSYEIHVEKFESKLLDKIVSGKKVTSIDIWNCVKENDYFAIKVAKIFADKMAKIIDILLKINNPEIIIIGGGMTDAGDIIIKYINDSYNSHYSSTFVKPNIVIATLGNKAGILGATKLAMI